MKSTITDTLDGNAIKTLIKSIEKRLLENNLIYKYPKGKGNFRLNYVWKDMYAPKVLK